MTFYALASWLVSGVLWPTLPEVGLVLGWLWPTAIMAAGLVMAWRVARR